MLQQSLFSGEYQVGDKAKLLPISEDVDWTSKMYFEKEYPLAINQVGVIKIINGNTLEMKFDAYENLITVSKNEVELMEGF